MTAKDTARRLVAAHGRLMAASRVMHRRAIGGREMGAAFPDAREVERAAARLTFWRAVASALAREAA